jgi:hypothetical protein
MSFRKLSLLLIYGKQQLSPTTRTIIEKEKELSQ